MLHSINNISLFDTAINCFITTYKNDIMALTNAQWKDEDYDGKSYKQWRIMQYYNLLYFLIIVYNDVLRLQAKNKSWSYFETKYNIDNYRKCLACQNIDIDKGLNCFGLPFQIDGNGIQDIGIEQGVIIEPDNIVNIIQIDLLGLINNPKGCINNIETVCL